MSNIELERIKIKCRFIILLNHSISVDKRAEEAGVRGITTPRVTARHRNSSSRLHGDSYNQIHRVATRLYRRKNVINQRVLNIPSEDAFIVKFDGVIKTSSRIEPVPVLGASFFSHFSLSCSSRVQSLSRIQSSFRPRSNLTSIKSAWPPYQFSVRLMTKRRRRPPATVVGDRLVT